VAETLAGEPSGAVWRQFLLNVADELSPGKRNGGSGASRSYRHGGVIRDVSPSLQLTHQTGNLTPSSLPTSPFLALALETLKTSESAKERERKIRDWLGFTHQNG